MKALTLHQPWASLVALGVKTVETRSWSTKYRGPLAIHAGVKRPPLMHLPPLWPRGKTRLEQLEHNARTWLCIDTITDPAHQRPHRPGERVPRSASTPTLFFPGEGPHARRWDDSLGTDAVTQGSALLLPLGAVVATCELVNVVPMVAASKGPDDPDDCCSLYYGPGIDGPWTLTDSNVFIDRACGNNGWDDITEQIPYGDYQPGRFAWLLRDIKPTTERCPACMGHPKQPRTRIEGGSSSCVHCNRTLTFNFIDRPSADCDCAGARSEACSVCLGAGHCDAVTARGKQGLWEWTP